MFHNECYKEPKHQVWILSIKWAVIRITTTNIGTGYHLENYNIQFILVYSLQPLTMFRTIQIKGRFHLRDEQTNLQDRH